MSYFLFPIPYFLSKIDQKLTTNQRKINQKSMKKPPGRLREAPGRAPEGSGGPRKGSGGDLDAKEHNFSQILAAAEPVLGPSGGSIWAILGLRLRLFRVVSGNSFLKAFGGPIWRRFWTVLRAFWGPFCERFVRVVDCVLKKSEREKTARGPSESSIFKVCGSYKKLNFKSSRHHAGVILGSYFLFLLSFQKSTKN